MSAHSSRMFNASAVAKLYPDGEPPEQITHVDGSGKGFSSAAGLEALQQLLRLDLSANQLTKLGGIANSTSLKWLSLASNALRKLPPLNIPELQVGVDCKMRRR